MAKLRHEADHVLPRATSFSDLERAPYLNCFIKEVLRLHPSAGFTRMVNAPEGLSLGGVHLPKDTEIFFIPTIVHRQERYFERALEFIPERWEDGSKLKMTAHAYFPFSLGPRNCIGMKLVRFFIRSGWRLWTHFASISSNHRPPFLFIQAQLELRCILVEAIRRFDIIYDEKQGVPATYLSMTLDPGKVYVKVKPRTGPGADLWTDKLELAEG